MKPTVGRIVYYKSLGSLKGEFPSVMRAAIVTDIQDVVGEGSTKFQVRLAVFNPEGLFFSGWLDEGEKPGNWSWMPFQKDQQARIGYGAAPTVEGTQDNTNNNEK